MDRMLSPIEPDEITPIDAVWLVKAHQFDYPGDQVEGTLERARQGLCRVWRVGDGSGVVVTELADRAGGRECIIWAFAGERVLELIPQMYEELQEYAMRQGCRWLTANARRPGLAKIYTQLVGPPTSHYFVKELSDG